MITLGQVTFPPKVQKFPTQGVSIKRMGEEMPFRKQHHDHDVIKPIQNTLTENEYLAENIIMNIMWQYQLKSTSLSTE